MLCLCRRRARRPHLGNVSLNPKWVQNGGTHPVKPDLLRTLQWRKSPSRALAKAPRLLMWRHYSRYECGIHICFNIPVSHMGLINCFHICSQCFGFEQQFQPAIIPHICILWHRAPNLACCLCFDWAGGQTGAEEEEEPQCQEEPV